MKTTRTWIGLGAVAAAWASACGVSDRNVSGVDDPAKDASSSGGEGGGSGGNVSAGGGAGGGPNGSGGSSSDGGAAGAGGGGGSGGAGGVSDTDGGPDVICIGTGTRCGAGDVPETCTQGIWVPGTACPSSEVCSNGVCAALRVTGGLVSLASSPEPPLGAPPPYRLSGQSLELMPRVCTNPVKFCVTGGIQP